MKKFSQVTLVLGFCLLMMVFQSHIIVNKCDRVKALTAYVPAGEREAGDQTKHGTAITVSCPGSPVTFFTNSTVTPPFNIIPNQLFFCYNETGHQDDYSAHVYSPPRLA